MALHTLPIQFAIMLNQQKDATMKKWTTSLFALGAATALSLGLASTAQADDPVKAAFVYVGPVSDHGWSYAHDQARLAMEAELGDMVETTYLESVPEGADAVRALERLARTDHDIIFATSFGYMESVMEVAERFPDTVFEHATGYLTSENFANYNGHFYEGRYVMGKIAGLETETNTIGYIASYAIPEVVGGINAFMLGAQSVNPDFKVKIVWVNTWYDPGKEADAAKALLDQGADVISQHTDSPAPLQVAEERGAIGFGQASDMINFAPKAQLTAIVDDWSVYYKGRVKAALDGTWKSEDVWGGLAAEMVLMAPYTNVPEDVAKAAAEMEEKIRTGAFHPFTGPIFKQDGSQAAAEGEVLDDGTLLGMNWYVKGIDDKLPQ